MCTPVDTATSCTQSHLDAQFPILNIYVLDLVVLAQVEAIHVIILLQWGDQWNICVQWLESRYRVSEPFLAFVSNADKINACVRRKE
jgi:hypothetical protein